MQFVVLFCHVTRDSSVGIASKSRAVRPRNSVYFLGKKFMFFPDASVTFLGFIGFRSAATRRVEERKLPEREADQYLHPVPRLKFITAIPSLPRLF